MVWFGKFVVRYWLWIHTELSRLLRRSMWQYEIDDGRYQGRLTIVVMIIIRWIRRVTATSWCSDM
jgi:hypothetical protein